MGKKAKKAKKPKAKKKKKKKKAKKKKKKRKKKKAKKVRFPGGKRRKGQHKSKAAKAGGKRAAAAQKKKGVGLFKPVTVSAALSAITGIKGKTTRGQVTKAVWVHIKKKGLNKGRNVGKIDGIFVAARCSSSRAPLASTSSERMRFSFPSDLNAWEQGVLTGSVTFTKVLAETGD